MSGCVGISKLTWRVMLHQMQGEHLQKYNRIQRIDRPRRKRKNKLTRHHDKAKSLGGTYDSWNIYKLSAEHHQAYHKLFGLRTFDEAAAVLLRMQTFHQQVAS